MWPNIQILFINPYHDPPSKQKKNTPLGLHNMFIFAFHFYNSRRRDTVQVCKLVWEFISWWTWSLFFNKASRPGLCDIFIRECVAGGLGGGGI